MTVKRYDCRIGDSIGLSTPCCEMYSNPVGQFVSFFDYLELKNQLKAERQRVAELEEHSKKLYEGFHQERQRADDEKAINKHLDLVIRQSEGVSANLRRRTEKAESENAELKARMNNKLSLPISVCADQVKPYYKVFLRGDIMEVLNENGIEFIEKEVNLKLNSSLDEVSKLIQPFKKDDIVKTEISRTGRFNYFRVNSAHANGALDVVGLDNGMYYGLSANGCILHERLDDGN